MDTSPLHFILVVWGEVYTELFLDVVLQSQLTPNNLPGLQHKEHYIYKIYTTANDAETIQESPAFQRLAAIMRVEIHVIQSQQNAYVEKASLRYNTMSEFHKRAIQDGARDGAFLVFLAPDAIMSDGSFPAIERRMLEGAEMILLSGIRVTKETALPAIRARYRRPDGTIHMDAADLTDCVFEFAHPHARALVWGAERFNSHWPSQMFWFAPPAGILAHCWHLHPILVKAHDQTERFFGTIDGDYIESAGTRLERIHVIQDSDEACLIEISREDHEKAALEGCAPFSMRDFLRWGQRGTNAFHRNFVDRSILFKGRAHTEAAMTGVRQEAARIVETLKTELEAYRIDIPVLRSFDELAGYPAVYLYGSGECGRTILTHARRHGLTNIRGFLDSRTAGEAEGLPVYRFEDYRKDVRRSDDMILITSMYLEDIARMLLGHGITGFLSAKEMYSEIQFFRSELETDRVEFGIVLWKATEPPASAV